MREDLRVTQTLPELRPKKVADDLVVTLSIHALLHGLGHLEAVTPDIFPPCNAVARVGIDDNPVHIEDKCTDSRHMLLNFRSVTPVRTCIWMIWRL